MIQRVELAWSGDKDKQDQKMLAFMKALIKLRKDQQPVLSYGTYAWQVDEEAQVVKLTRQKRLLSSVRSLI